MKTKAFFLSLLAMAILTACNHGEAVKDGGYIEENQTESEQEMQTEDTLDNIMKCLDEEVPDYDIASVPKDYEALVLIGGMTWRNENTQQIKTLVEECYQKGKVLGGICDASAFLGTIGVLNDVMHTSNDMNDLKQWAGSAYTGETKYIAKQAVRDKNIITANGTAPMPK